MPARPAGSWLALIASCSLLAVFPACATVDHSALAPRVLETRQAQSRTFETVERDVVLKAALDVLQDEGYVIRDANAELGLVIAAKEWRSGQQNKGLKFVKWLAAAPTYGASLLIPAGRDEFTALEATVNLAVAGTATRVRFSLVSRVTDGKGQLRSVTPVDDPLAYQGLLSRLDKALYLQREGL